MRRSAIEASTSREYNLEKKYRNEEERSYKPRRKPWHRYILDFNEGTFLCRNCISWLKIILFYIIFCAVLIGFFVANYIVFAQSIDLRLPRLLRDQPSIAMAPILSSSPYRTPVIEYALDKEVQIRDYANGINEFLGKFGKIDRERYGPCGKDDTWGYKKAQPCVFLKLNRILGWHANAYENIEELPKKVPIDLKNFINTLPQEERKKRIWISCNYPKEKVANIKFYPGPFIAVRSIEYDEKLYYRQTELKVGEVYTKYRAFYSADDNNRVVAMQIEKPHKDESIKFSCNAWAKNIDQSDEEKMCSFIIKINTNAASSLFCLTRGGVCRYIFLMIIILSYLI